ncbi:hypothetical protein ES703_47775 [subsurface metagenome]
MRLSYNTPVSSISGRTNLEGGITFRESLGQQIASPARAPRDRQTIPQTAARIMFAVLKTEYSELNNDQVNLWRKFSLDLRTQAREPHQPKTPWAAFYFINSSRYLANLSSISVPPIISPTFEVVKMTAVSLSITPSEYFTVSHTLSGYTSGIDYMKVQISAALSSHQRHATPSEMLLLHTRRGKSVMKPNAPGTSTSNSYIKRHWINGDWINCRCTPLNGDFLPGVSKTFCGTITVNP